MGRCVAPMTCFSAFFYRDDGEGAVAVVAEGGDEAVVHAEPVAVERRQREGLDDVAWWDYLAQFVHAMLIQILYVVTLQV